MKITKDTMVEDVYRVPGILEYCLQNRVTVFTCSGAYPRSFGELLAIKKVENPEAFLDGLNAYLEKRAENDTK
ncbi:hypothetical protein EQM14_13160 [Caproiciproducens sp. NJN-50]|uniref:hypothetical protein n=1 Tax=Acutalibacteraceae TaxID=3082771 RepID=UPI000FFE2FE8|nr:MULTISPECIES: hypothetical protein [Acutalibacteraceae]QAT50631.1 hypothetical protein EQM14_13160 [Caproiciproducens sp. NJN-50]